MRKLTLASLAVGLLCSSAFAYDPTGWHLPGYVPGSEGQHSAAYDAAMGHHPTGPVVHPSPPHVLTARDNAYILCVTGREPADFDFDGTCHQITKNNQNGSPISGGGTFIDYTDSNGVRWQFYQGSRQIEASKGGITWTFDTSSGHAVLTNTCSGPFC